MRKSFLYLILTYGLFLGWLLSFLYNGPALNIIFSSTKVNSGYLAITYILTPSIVLLGIGFCDLKETYKAAFMKYGIIACFLGTVLSLLIKDFNLAGPAYILAGIMGIFSVVFITGWGCYFVDLLNIKIMYKCMAYVICLGYILFHINKVLKYQGLHNMIILSLFIYLMGAYCCTAKLTAGAKGKREDYNIDLPLDLLVMMCFLMFLLNVGGGIVQTLIGPVAEKSFGNIHIFDISMYILIGAAIYKLPGRLPTEITLTMGTVMIACGYLLLILFTKSPLPAYGLTVTGYAVLDIFLWTLVGEMGYIFGKPIKIFAFIMAANLMAVFVGNLLGVFLTDTKEHMYVALAATAISAILAFTFLPFINQMLQKGIAQMNDVKKIREAVKGVITEDKAVKLLTEKELEIYKFMKLGLKNKEIAAESGISDNTLKGHARKIYHKLGVSNKKELMNSLDREERS
ncbi:MAG: response regulator transcription factor [Peptococcaceae bacterium]